jgi:hypothetical protein
VKNVVCFSGVLLGSGTCNLGLGFEIPDSVGVDGRIYLEGSETRDWVGDPTSFLS